LDFGTPNLTGAIPSSLGCSDPVEAFRKASLPHELRRLRRQLAVEQVTAKIQERQGGIGNKFR
jgi:hypothetical protein